MTCQRNNVLGQYSSKTNAFLVLLLSTYGTLYSFLKSLDKICHFPLSQTSVGCKFVVRSSSRISFWEAISPLEPEGIIWRLRGNEIYLQRNWPKLRLLYQKIKVFVNELTIDNHQQIKFYTKYRIIQGKEKTYFGQNPESNRQPLVSASLHPKWK